MGTCSAKPNCTVPRNHIVPFDADPDIAGNGVLAAVFISVWSTYALILWGYFFDDNVSDDCLCDFDRWIRYKSLSLRNRIKRWLLINEESEKRSNSSTSLMKVCLMLSDQQLVMGTAMLLIGFATHCDIPQYYFEIVADYGWVTSSVFYGSVMITYPIFQQNPAMRHWRAIWMTLQAGFIIVGQILTYHKYWMVTFGMSTQCIWNGFSTWYTDLSTTILLILTLSFQLWSYLWAMATLYPRQFGWTAYPYQSVEYVLGIPARLHTRLKGTWRRPSRLQKGVLVATYTIFMITHMVSQISSSSLLGLVRTFAMLLWGFKYIIEYRQSDDVSRVQGVQGSEDEWSAGQILPLLMLALPLFAAIELYWAESSKHPNPEDTTSVSALKRGRSAIVGLLCSTHSVISSSTAPLLPASYKPRLISSWNLGAREVFEPYCQARISLNSKNADLVPCHPAFQGSQEAVFELEYLTIEKLWFRTLLVVMCVVLLGVFIYCALCGFVI